MKTAGCHRSHPYSAPPRARTRDERPTQAQQRRLGTNSAIAPPQHGATRPPLVRDAERESEPGNKFAPATGFARVSPRRPLSFTQRPHPIPTPPARPRRHQRGDIHSPTSQKIPPNPSNHRRPKIIGQHGRHERHSATTHYSRNTPPPTLKRPRQLPISDVIEHTVQANLPHRGIQVLPLCPTASGRARCVVAARTTTPWPSCPRMRPPDPWSPAIGCGQQGYELPGTRLAAAVGMNNGAGRRPQADSVDQMMKVYADFAPETTGSMQRPRSCTTRAARWSASAVPRACRRRSIRSSTPHNCPRKALRDRVMGTRRPGGHSPWGRDRFRAAGIRRRPAARTSYR